MNGKNKKPESKSPSSPWEIDPGIYARSLEKTLEKEKEEGASFPGGKPFPVIQKEFDLSEGPPAPPVSGFYSVNGRPVRLVDLPDGGLDVLALDMRTGEFARDMSYLSQCIAPEGDVDPFTESEFEEYVAGVRGTIDAKKSPDR